MNLNTEQYFSTVPTLDCPRSVFDRSFTHKMTMNCDYLYPIFIDEALPGDSMKMDFEVFGRILNPLVVPVMDELYFETLWFKCDCRLLWNHWVNFCGEQENPGDSVDYVIPTILSKYQDENNAWQYADCFTLGNLADCFGIPPYINNLKVNSLPFRMYNRVYNEWFRDENLINSVTLELSDTDDCTNYTLLKSAKIHDYFTSCLPFAQKFGQVSIPVPLISNGNLILQQVSDSSHTLTENLGNGKFGIHSNDNLNTLQPADDQGDKVSQYVSGLSTQNMAIDDIRFAFKLSEYRNRCATSGTRYIEWIKSQFNVSSSDERYHRTVFLGSTREMIDINTVVQTSSTDSTSPQGNLTAFGVVSHHGSGFSTSFEEHGYLMGLARIRHNPIYQQGLHKMWKRSTLLDFYLPVFNGISEQPVSNYEIYCQGGSVLDSDGRVIDVKAFGFQEAWAEYRYKPSYISGLLRSKGANQEASAITTIKPVDVYHLAENFASLPQLNQSFIEEDVPLDRVLSVTYDPDISDDNPLNYPQFIFDFRFNYNCARPMPVRNIPSSLYTRF